MSGTIANGIRLQSYRYIVVPRMVSSFFRYNGLDWREDYANMRILHKAKPLFVDRPIFREG